MIQWTLTYDGLSLAMLQGPDNRVFRLQELGTGRHQMWGTAHDNDELCDALARASEQALLLPLAQTTIAAQELAIQSLERRLRQAQDRVIELLEERNR